MNHHDSSYSDNYLEFKISVPTLLFSVNKRQFTHTCPISSQNLKIANNVRPLNPRAKVVPYFPLNELVPIFLDQTQHTLHDVALHHANHIRHIPLPHQ